jgi:hypothetical protein
LLAASQISTLQKNFTNALAQNWSNLPCGSNCRNGIQFGTLASAQLAAAKAVIQAAAGRQQAKDSASLCRSLLPTACWARLLEAIIRTGNCNQQMQKRHPFILNMNVELRFRHGHDVTQHSPACLRPWRGRHVAPLMFFST